MIEQMLGYVLAALMVGLWWGERGRRQAAERWVVSGSPEEGASGAVSRLPSQEAEDRYIGAMRAAEKETAQRMFVDWRDELRSQGLPVDEKKLRQDVETVLAGEDVLE